MYLVTQFTEQTEESRVFYQSEYFCLTIKDPENLQSEEEQQQHHIQNQIMRRVGKWNPCQENQSKEKVLCLTANTIKDIGSNFENLL